MRQSSTADVVITTRHPRRADRAPASGIATIEPAPKTQEQQSEDAVVDPNPRLCERHERSPRRHSEPGDEECDACGALLELSRSGAA